MDNNIIKAEDIEVYDYGVDVIVLNLRCIIFSLIISAFFGKIKQGLYFFVYFIPIRILLGGYHCKDPKNCLILFQIIFLVVFSVYSGDYIVRFKKEVVLLAYLFVIHKIIRESLILKLISTYFLLLTLGMYLILLSKDIGNVIGAAVLMNDVLYSMEIVKRLVERVRVYNKI